MDGIYTNLLTPLVLSVASAKSEDGRRTEFRHEPRCLFVIQFSFQESRNARERV